MEQCEESFYFVEIPNHCSLIFQQVDKDKKECEQEQNSTEKMKQKQTVSYFTYSFNTIQKNFYRVVFI